jgi:anti-sigma factor RsiW
MTPEHDKLLLAGAYVLGTLDAEERDAFDAHLPACAECQREVRSMQRVAIALAASTPSRTPRPELRDRVLGAATASRAHVISEGGTGFGVGRTSSTVPSGFGRTAPDADRRVSSWMHPASWLPVAALLIVSLALGTYSQRLQSRIDSLESRLDDAVRRAELAERATGDAQRAANSVQSAMAVLSSPDMARVDLAGQEVAPDARARAFWSRNHGLVFTATNLPAAPPGSVYQVWVLTAGAPISAGLINLDASGGTTEVLATAPDIPPPAGVAVSLEPEGGRPAPTGKIYLAGKPSA